MPQTDVVIVGSGIAALAVAYYICEELNVVMLTKGRVQDGNSAMAQGGIAGALAKEDSWRLHGEDTVLAGDGHTDREAAMQLAKEGKELLLHLLQDGLPADRDVDGSLKLGMEGAHRLHRIVHSGGDESGRMTVQFLLEKIRHKVKIIEHTMVTEILVENGVCYGVRTLGRDGRHAELTAGAVVLAAGGCGKLYAHTSNHPSSTGDGPALAYRAGARLADMEFVQFHPTMLVKDGHVKGLISEAVRGEGAFLQDSSGERIMEKAHPLKDLAPRDIVSREIFRRLQAGESTFLNIRSIRSFDKRFPGIASLCRNHGISLEHGLIPVKPGMHFFMGGVKTGSRGQTSLRRLYAAGESACTGVHGANRLASNSLLEGLVFGRRIAAELKNVKQAEKTSVPGRTLIKAYSVSRLELEEMMEAYAGIERSGEGLRRLTDWFRSLTYREADSGSLTWEEIELSNMVTAAGMIAFSALEREESRGGHYRSDFPVKREEWLRKEIIWERVKKRLEVTG
ncbi:L-aspartate oxidase [Bacillus mangrovi]|uniref:L-aspartate oxidase n=1 Tax=Metabacillus mangrovi TaxID=1491830 RepID=A0A7X2S3K7_9BACI|nr:L-aspartate oxidase [Metabacillus mangrovi]MTH52999.1 L-aspartate oxidase [Metabacillus mangrovi]